MFKFLRVYRIINCGIAIFKDLREIKPFSSVHWMTFLLENVSSHIKSEKGVWGHNLPVLLFKCNLEIK